MLGKFYNQAAPPETPTILKISLKLSRISLDSNNKKIFDMKIFEWTSFDEVKQFRARTVHFNKLLHDHRQ